MKLPKQINIRFTEKDRQQAGPYNDPNKCLLCTALKRRGYKTVSVGGFGDAFIEGITYTSKQRFDSNIKDEHALVPPYYLREVVGMKLTLILHHNV